LREAASKDWWAQIYHRYKTGFDGLKTLSETRGGEKHGPAPSFSGWLDPLHDPNLQ
jgi:hypothetical protein